MARNKVKKAKDPNHLGFGTLLAFKSSDVAQAGIQAIVLGYLTLYCTDTMGLQPAAVGVLLMASKIVDAFTDLFAGWLVDNTHTRFGKARPYDLCIVGVTMCSLLLFGGNPAWATTVKYVWIFLMYTLVFSVFTTLRGAANTPYTIRIFHNNDQLIRKVASYGGIVTMFAAIVINTAFPLVMGRLATDARGWTITVAIFAIPLTLLGLVRFFTLKEDPSVDAGEAAVKISPKEILTMFRKNQYVWIYAIMMLAFNISTSLGVGTYYFKWIIGNTSAMAALSAVSIITLPLMLCFPWIMKKIGSMSRMVAIFGIIGAIGYGSIMFAGQSLVRLLIGTLIGSVAVLPLSYYGILFIMRCCTYNQMKGLPRMDGSAGILSNFSSKVGGALGSAITGVLLSAAGYISSDSAATVQPESAINMIRFLEGGMPAIVLIIVAICAFRFDHLESDLIPAWEKEQKNAAEASAVKA